MMGAYKVIFRADKSADSQNRITWEQGCPLMFDAVQISRHTETGVAFLQAKLRNIGADAVTSFKSEITCRFKDGSAQEFTIEPLDADMPPGGFYEIKPIELPRGDAVSTDASVKSAITESGEWRTSTNPARIPEGTRLELSEAALKERTLELEEHGCKMSEFAAPFAVEVHDSWTMCACSQPNVGTERCVECGLTLQPYDKSCESEEALIRQAGQRAEAKRRKENEEAIIRAKRIKIAKRVVPPIVLSVAVGIIIGIVYSLGYLGGEPQAAREHREMVGQLVDESRVNIDPYLAYLNTDVPSSLMLDLPDELESKLEEVSIMGVDGSISAIVAEDGKVTSVIWRMNERAKADNRDDFIESLNDFFGSEYELQIDSGTFGSYESYTYTYTWDDERASCKAIMEYTHIPGAKNEEEGLYYSVEWITAEDKSWRSLGAEFVTVA